MRGFLSGVSRFFAPTAPITSSRPAEGLTSARSAGSRGLAGANHPERTRAYGVNPRPSLGSISDTTSPSSRPPTRGVTTSRGCSPTRAFFSDFNDARQDDTRQEDPRGSMKGTDR